jgi:hypothetical protein
MGIFFLKIPTISFEQRGKLKIKDCNFFVSYRSTFLAYSFGPIHDTEFLMAILYALTFHLNIEAFSYIL